MKMLTFETTQCSGKISNFIEPEEVAVGIKATAVSLIQTCKKLDVLEIIAEELGLE